MAIWLTTIEFEILLCISLDIEWELSDLLAIYEMEMHWMHVRGQVDDVEIVCFANFIHTIGAVHSIHH